MRNTTLSRLALLGLASVSSIAFAANTVTGEIRFDARSTMSQKTAADLSVADSLKKPDNLFVSRARLDMMGDVAKNWTYGIRLEANEMENMQIGLDPALTAAQSGLPVTDGVSLASSIDANLARACVSWSGIDGIRIMMGRIGTPDISADRLYYKPFIGAYPGNMAIGAITAYSGDHAGLSLDGKAGPVGYSFGVWKQTDFRKLEGLSATQSTDGEITTLALFETAIRSNIAASNFDAKSLRLGYGGRLSFATQMNPTTSYGFGVGYNQAPLNMPIAVATISTYGGSNQSLSPYSIATFNNLTNYAVDGSAVFGAFQVNMGYEGQKLKADTTQAYGTASVANAVFNQDGKASSYWVETGYLIMGDSYKFDDSQAVVSGVNLRENQGGLELVARWGYETRRNVLALANSVGFADFSSDTSVAVATVTSPLLVSADLVSLSASNKYLMLAVDNTGTDSSSVLVVSDEKAFEEVAKGYAIGLNYYVSENAVIKAEFEQRYNEFTRYYASAVDHDSLSNKSESTLRLRADFSF